jgi:hypothetical protein
MEEEFVTNLMRVLAAQLHFQSALLASREMFGRSYFSLGISEKVAVDQAVVGFVGSNYQTLTPELLAAQQAQQPVGFRAPSADP